MRVGNNVLHHQLRFPQLLLQLSQLKVSWGGNVNTIWAQTNNKQKPTTAPFSQPGSGLQFILLRDALWESICQKMTNINIFLIMLMHFKHECQPERVLRLDMTQCRCDTHTRSYRKSFNNTLYLTFLSFCPIFNSYFSRISSTLRVPPPPLLVRWLKVAKIMNITVVEWYSLIFLFLFSDRTEGNRLSEGLLFPLDVI